MLDTTSYVDKLPSKLNEVLKTFTGSECIMVRKIKDNDKTKIKIKQSAGNCHLNVKTYIDKYGGKSISGWLLNRTPTLIVTGMYVWSFHSVWLKPDDKLLDITDDRNYVGRDKTIFVQDLNRVPDLIEGISYNNFLVFTDETFADHYGKSIGKQLKINTPYWSDDTLMRLLEINEHSGVYRLVNEEYPQNIKKMCDEYEIDIVNGKPVPKPNSKYADIGVLPIQILFDYSLHTN